MLWSNFYNRYIFIYQVWLERTWTSSWILRYQYRRKERGIFHKVGTTIFILGYRTTNDWFNNSQFMFDLALRRIISNLLYFSHFIDFRILILILLWYTSSEENFFQRTNIIRILKFCGPRNSKKQKLSTKLKKHLSFSYFNHEEMLMVIKYVEALLTDKYVFADMNENEIGIITPYFKQVSFFFDLIVIWIHLIFSTQYCILLYPFKAFKGRNLYSIICLINIIAYFRNWNMQFNCIWLFW